MKIINNGIVFSDDIKRILDGNNALNFDYKKEGIITPDINFLKELRNDFKKDVNKIFNNNAIIINEDDMLDSINKSIFDVIRRYPHCYSW